MGKKTNILKRAKDTAVRREHTTSISVRHRTSFGQELMLVGGSEELGGWNANEGVKLTWTEGHIWTGNVIFSFIRGTEFKFVRKEGDFMDWEEGPNRRIDTSTLVIQDAW
eukprot:Platyproteum_vivax@DN4218_c0_g1_i1.p1